MGRKAATAPQNEGALNNEATPSAEASVSAPSETASSAPELKKMPRAVDEKVYERGKFAVFATGEGFQVRDNLKRNVSPVLKTREEAEHLVNGLSR